MTITNQKYFSIIILILSLSIHSISANDYDSLIEKKIDALLLKMTLKEKIGQMCQLNSRSNPENLIPHIEKGEIGSLLNVENRDYINILQKAAIKNSRLGIPLIIGRDVIHGYKTIFPIPLGQAASFNPEIVERGARIAAIEASANGIRWTFAPMIDISRDARWGRIAESLGEDPYLTSVLGVAMIKGFQGEKMNDKSSMAACAKHFFGYGAAEGGKDYNSTNIPERLLRNVYLKPFEAAVKAKVATFMTAFNDNDGIPASGNKYMLRNVLRDEWKFDGFVVSDWGSITEMINHRFSKDKKEAAQHAVSAGVDMEMATTSYAENIEKLIEEKKLDIHQINNSVRNILRIKYRLGLFDNPYIDMSLPLPHHKKEFLDDAIIAAEQSIVLLKNDNKTLPITNQKVKRIAIIGPLANAPHEQLGTWIFDGEKEKTLTPLIAIKEQYGNEYQIIYEPGLEYSRDKSDKNFKAAIRASKKADIVLFFGGEESILSGEAHSLADLNFQGAQTQLLNDIKKTGKPVVLIVLAGRPLTIANEIQQSSATLYAWHPGTMGGLALANIIFGKTVPSGKLPVSFPKTTGQIPVHYNHFMTGRPATGKEKLINEIPIGAKQTSTGARSFYLDAGSKPLFPFGYGLSYTSYSYKSFTTNKIEYSVNDTIRLEFELSNSGEMKGTEIVQLYVSDLVGSIARPIKELIRFQRIELNPTEAKHIRFAIPVQELAFYGIDLQKKAEPGEFEFMIGPNSETSIKTKITIQ